ncbi:MAG TPA: dihydroorotate dehydrogenase (quinone), partial [Telluria sp.]
MYGFARPFLFGLDAERAHALTLQALEAAYRTGLNPLVSRKPAPFPTRVLGLTFPNPVGLAAGLDKNGTHIDALLALGFGFIEIGTVTPRPQEGNPKPRMFRIPEHRAVINRLGFNNGGVDALVRNVEAAKRREGLLGINIGKNKDTPNESAEDDYLFCMERVYPLADYITVNISSPNTAGLRELQEEQSLRRLITILRDMQELLGAKHGKRIPMLVKIAPDLSDSDIDAAARVLADLQVDGVIATNTTVSRIAVQGARHADEAGGLSGQPLMGSSTMVLRKLRTRLPESIPL